MSINIKTATDEQMTALWNEANAAGRQAAMENRPQMKHLFDLKMDFQVAYDNLRSHYETMIYDLENRVFNRDNIIDEQENRIDSLNEKVFNLVNEIGCLKEDQKMADDQIRDLEKMINWAEMENRKEYM